MLNKGYLTARTDDESNECYTPFYAVEPILKYLPKDKIIWCPFDEEWSAFYQLLKENGYQVVRSSLKEGQDFFEYEPDKCDILVSNPPFTCKDEVIERCYSFNKPFALILPVVTIQSVRRFKSFSKGIQILAFDRRIKFHTGGDFENYNPKGVAFGSAYYCRDLLPNDLILEHLEEYSRPLKKSNEYDDIDDFLNEV